MDGVVMEVKPDDKKVILYKEELSADEPTKKDDVQEYLNSQGAPEGEKIEIPTDSNKDTEGETEAADV